MPKVNFRSDNVAVIPFDLEKAKELVQKSGYDGTPIQIMVDTGNAPFRARSRPSCSRAGKLPVSRVEIVEFDVGTAWTMSTKGEYQAYVSYITSDINDTDELATIQADVNGGRSAFFTWYNNEEVQKLLTEARRRFGPSQARRALRQGAGDRL